MGPGGGAFSGLMQQFTSGEGGRNPYAFNVYHEKLPRIPKYQDLEHEIVDNDAELARLGVDDPNYDNLARFNAQLKAKRSNIYGKAVGVHEKQSMDNTRLQRGLNIMTDPEIELLDQGVDPTKYQQKKR